jgi:hypothetical protein
MLSAMGRGPKGSTARQRSAQPILRFRVGGDGTFKSAFEQLSSFCPSAAVQHKKCRGSIALIFFRARNAYLPDALIPEATGMRKEDAMRKLLLAAAAAAALVAAVPASAQVYLGADPGGAGVQVGPFGFGVGPRYGYRDRDEYYAYGRACPLVRERIVTPSGRVIFQTRRACY